MADLDLSVVEELHLVPEVLQSSEQLQTFLRAVVDGATSKNHSLEASSLQSVNVRLNAVIRLLISQLCTPPLISVAFRPFAAWSSGATAEEKAKDIIVEAFTMFKVYEEYISGERDEALEALHRRVHLFLHLMEYHQRSPVLSQTLLLREYGPTALELLTCHLLSVRTVSEDLQQAVQKVVKELLHALHTIYNTNSNSKVVTTQSKGETTTIADNYPRLTEILLHYFRWVQTNTEGLIRACRRDEILISVNPTVRGLLKDEHYAAPSDIVYAYKAKYFEYLNHIAIPLQTYHPSDIDQAKKDLVREKVVTLNKVTLHGNLSESIFAEIRKAIVFLFDLDGQDLLDPHRHYAQAQQTMKARASDSLSHAEDTESEDLASFNKPADINWDLVYLLQQKQSQSQGTAKEKDEEKEKEPPDMKIPSRPSFPGGFPSMGSGQGVVSPPSMHLPRNRSNTSMSNNHSAVFSPSRHRTASSGEEYLRQISNTSFCSALTSSSAGSREKEAHSDSVTSYIYVNASSNKTVTSLSVVGKEESMKTVPIESPVSSIDFPFHFYSPQYIFADVFTLLAAYTLMACSRTFAGGDAFFILRDLYGGDGLVFVPQTDGKQAGSNSGISIAVKSNGIKVTVSECYGLYSEEDLHCATHKSHVTPLVNFQCVTSTILILSQEMLDGLLSNIDSGILDEKEVHEKRALAIYRILLGEPQKVMHRAVTITPLLVDIV